MLEKSGFDEIAEVEKFKSKKKKNLSKKPTIPEKP